MVLEKLLPTYSPLELYSQTNPKSDYEVKL